MADMKRALIQALCGIDPQHDERMANANPPIGQFKKESESFDPFDFTRNENDRLALIADEASILLVLDGSTRDRVNRIETEWALQNLERDYVAITGHSVKRPRHADYPEYVNFDDYLN